MLKKKKKKKELHVPILAPDLQNQDGGGVWAGPAICFNKPLDDSVTLMRAPVS